MLGVKSLYGESSTPVERGLPLANLTKLHIGTDVKTINLLKMHTHIYTQRKPRDIMTHYDSVVTGSMHDNYNLRILHLAAMATGSACLQYPVYQASEVTTTTTKVMVTVFRCVCCAEQ